jgi:heme/copper-type cytochrome/quinol oxidase subunit 3
MTEEWPTPGAVVDVGDLPRHALGARTPLFWGTILLIAIESTCFAILFTAYFYVRNNFVEWPPEARLQKLPGAIEASALSLTLVPTWLFRRAACAHRFAPMRTWLVVATLLSLVCIALRAWEFHCLPFPWTGSAYSSVVWASMGMHTLEIVTGAGEAVFLCAILFRKHVEMKSFEDVEASGLFWYFSVLVWLPFALVFYLDGLIR